MGHDKDHPLDCTASHVACEDCEDFDATAEQHGLMPKADKIKLDALVGGMTQAFIFLYRTAIFDMAANDTWYDLPFNIASPSKKNVTHDHTSNPEQITLTEGGTYEFDFSFSCTDAPGAIIVARLVDDGTEIPGSFAQNHYARPTVLLGRISHHVGPVFISANSVLELQVGTNVAGRDLNILSGYDDPDPTTANVATISIKKISDDTS